MDSDLPVFLREGTRSCKFERLFSAKKRTTLPNLHSQWHLYQRGRSAPDVFRNIRWKRVVWSSSSGPICGTSTSQVSQSPIAKGVKKSCVWLVKTEEDKPHSVTKLSGEELDVVPPTPTVNLQEEFFHPEGELADDEAANEQYTKLTAKNKKLEKWCLNIKMAFVIDQQIVICGAVVGCQKKHDKNHYTKTKHY